MKSKNASNTAPTDVPQRPGANSTSHEKLVPTANESRVWSWARMQELQELDGHRRTYTVHRSIWGTYTAGRIGVFLVEVSVSLLGARTGVACFIDIVTILVDDGQA